MLDCDSSNSEYPCIELLSQGFSGSLCSSLKSQVTHSYNLCVNSLERLTLGQPAPKHDNIFGP